MGTALRVAKDVGIDKASVWAGISPEGKRDLVQRMQEQGEVVAMVFSYLYAVSHYRLVME
jgi:P-type Cu+ transporter